MSCYCLFLVMKVVDEINAFIHLSNYKWRKQAGGNSSPFGIKIKTNRRPIAPPLIWCTAISEFLKVASETC